MGGEQEGMETGRKRAPSEAVSLRPRLCFHLPRALEIKMGGRDSGRADGLLSVASGKANWFRFVVNLALEEGVFQVVL